jgi:hypothetical protein
MQDYEDGDFGVVMEQALDEYREDTAPESPNQASSKLSLTSVIIDTGQRASKLPISWASS